MLLSVRINQCVQPQRFFSVNHHCKQELKCFLLSDPDQVFLVHHNHFLLRIRGFVHLVSGFLPLCLYSFNKELVVNSIETHLSIFQGFWWRPSVTFGHYAARDVEFLTHCLIVRSEPAPRFGCRGSPNVPKDGNLQLVGRSLPTSPPVCKSVFWQTEGGSWTAAMVTSATRYTCTQRLVAGQGPGEPEGGSARNLYSRVKGPGHVAVEEKTLRTSV